MKKIEILLSAYNGSKTIRRQIESILGQVDVDVHITIRDDGSMDDTCDIIQSLATVYGDSITLIRGNNIGWKKSFLSLLSLAQDADYYGFSDQDDYWFPYKIAKSITAMESDSLKGVKLAQVNSICTNEKLEPQQEQQKIYGIPRNRKSVIAQEYFQGCSMLWNKEAMQILQKYVPQGDLAHDFWVGVVCFYLGKIYFLNEPLFYHVRYGTNSSSDGNVLAGRKKRLKMLKTRKTVYMNPAQDLINGYLKYLNPKDSEFLQDIIKSKRNILKRLKLTLMPGFRRESLKSTILFKFVFLLGLY